jgi:4a-hydroxytetrahydrobiopterin dehydratase
MNISQLKCAPCHMGAATVTEAEQMILMQEVPQLQRQYKFKNFKSALEFTNKLGAIAELEDHHPAILTEWGSVTVTWWTHTINGLHHNDFIMAAKTDHLIA